MGKHHRLHAVACTHLGQHSGNVRLDRGLPNDQLVADLAVGQSLRREGEHLSLACREGIDDALLLARPLGRFGLRRRCPAVGVDRRFLRCAGGVVLSELLDHPQSGLRCEEGVAVHHGVNRGDQVLG